MTTIKYKSIRVPLSIYEDSKKAVDILRRKGLDKLTGLEYFIAEYIKMSGKPITINQGTTIGFAIRFLIDTLNK